MKYLVAGRIYTDFYPAVQYANLLHRIANLIVAVEAVADDYPSRGRESCG